MKLMNAEGSALQSHFLGIFSKTEMTEFVVL